VRIQRFFFEGRVVAKGIGGGIKHKFHWIAWKREGPKEGEPTEERVIQIMDDGCRTAKIALVAGNDELKYILATENMKAGDIIKTSGHIPRIPGWLKIVISSSAQGLTNNQTDSVKRKIFSLNFSECIHFGMLTF
jgi:ribosomal protein L2